MRTVADTIRDLPSPRLDPLEAPVYSGYSPLGVGLAVESMKRHMTDEGWQIFDGLEKAGYLLAGKGLHYGETDCRKIVERAGIGVVVLQDKREWDVGHRDFRDREARFHNVGYLSEREDLFKLTILKDSHQRPEYHRDSAAEIGCNAWIVYYHPTIVAHLAPYVRKEHLIRTYHSIDSFRVPQFNPASERAGALLSGAVSGAYHWRMDLVRKKHQLPETVYTPHPGYHKNGCQTYRYLETLNKFKVAICTSSRYGYALRKIIEATACGCVVLTDLPVDEKLPHIDGNLVRMGKEYSIGRVANRLRELFETYDEERQRYYAQEAQTFYDYHAVCNRLSEDIETLRATYVSPPCSIPQS